MRVSQVISQIFKSWGVEHVFGIPGKSISPLMLDLDSAGIEFILTRHEAGAGFAAAGYALGNQKIGIAMGTSGPGGTNLLTAAGQAKAYHLPLLIITGQPSAAESGKALGQDSSCFGTDLVKMFEPVTLFSARVERADLMSLYLQHAVEKAYSGVKGPVHLCIPFDVLMTMITPFTMQLPLYIPHMISSNIEAIVPLIDHARRPVLFIGKGVMSSEAYEEVKTVAEFWNIPVIATPGGKGVFPTLHPLFLGNFGLGGSLEASEYLQSGVDLMIVIGTKLSDMSLSGFDNSMLPKQVIHFDYDTTFISKSIMVPTYLVLGDAKHNLRKLIEMTGAKRNGMQSVAAAEQILDHIGSSSSGFLTGGETMKALRSALPSQTIFFGDDGSHTFYAIRDLAIYESGTFYFDDVFGAMGHAIGYAIGAKLALPDCPIVCITGDGCFMMHGTEVSTAVNNRIPVIFIVLNNGRLDMVDKGMSYNTGRSIGAIYDKPLDVAMFARSMGAKGICCRTMIDIQNAIEIGLESKSLPTVIEVLVDPLEIPPILSRLLSLA
jgi:acetolactate synthase-1/2/3 large subunit